MMSSERRESNEDSSSSDESVTWTPEDEKGFLRTLGALKAKNRDPKIYDSQTKFFEHKISEVQRATSSKETKTKKPNKEMYLRDYERKLVLERGGRVSDDEEDSDNEDKPVDSNIELQNRLKQEFKQAIGSDSDSDGDLLCKKIKTDEQKKQEDDDYYEWLKGEGSLQVDDADLRKLKDRWASKDLDEDEKFLRDYLYEKKYVNEVDDHQTPSYEDIVKEEEDEEKAELFEHKYNFRFEEPDQDFIKQFPRTVQESLRQQAGSKRKEKRSKRKEKRAEKKEAKEKLEAESDVDEDGEPKMKFRYRTVPANNFGLTTEEILAAEDAQLNAWASVHRKKSMDPLKKKKVFKAALEKSKIKKAVEDAKKPVVEMEIEEEPKTSKNDSHRGNKKKRQRQKNKKPAEELDNDRLRSYGVNTKKLKRLLYNKAKDQVSEKTGV
uniref:Protein KRI1 homolog n=1 Tax=Ditylenchus dipsaci TaxID=166011 RepID=A0A915DEY7_9BILA